jgi:hypothetical protein
MPKRLRRVCFGQSIDPAPCLLHLSGRQGLHVCFSRHRSAPEALGRMAVQAESPNDVRIWGRAIRSVRRRRRRWAELSITGDGGLKFGSA